MVVGVPRFPATLLIVLSLLWFTTTTIFKQPPPPFVIQHHLSYHSARHTLYNNKALPVPPLVKFDFSLFISRRHHHRKIGRDHFVSRSTLDPRYDVEMHLVPTGPNPLHH
ncbi:hypothetical protein Hanom_Chr05g00451331 [Helianthus anomalus]